MNKLVLREKVVCLLPEGTNVAIRSGANKKYDKPSEYLRQAILAQLERDGSRPASLPLPEQAA